MNNTKPKKKSMPQIIITGALLIIAYTRKTNTTKKLEHQTKTEQHIIDFFIHFSTPDNPTLFIAQEPVKDRAHDRTQT
jgi:hypothetical protein